MHAVVFQVDLVPGREQQAESELDFLTGMLKSTPGFVRVRGPGMTPTA